MSSLGSPDRPLRVAIVGSGPSGFYAAEALFRSDSVVTVDMIDRLPTPYGLVRGGVAPDHFKIKSVTKVYDRIAAKEGFAFLGNVTVGNDITVPELRAHYDAVIFACGAETDRRLDIPGEDLANSHTATEFVGWYNGHPDFADRTFDLSQEVAVIVGQGNVAVDVARILAKTVDELRETDIASYALEALAESRVREIHMIGRRGPVQAKFTTAEIKEFGVLADCDPVVDTASLVLDPVSQTELAQATSRHVAKNLAVLEEFAGREAPAKCKRFHLHFLQSPVALEGEGRVERVVLETNRLEGEAFDLRAAPIGATTELPCGLFFRSVGYRGLPIPGVPFDEGRGVFPNEGGCVTDGGEVVPGFYAVGWIGRGPSGIIGNNKPDSVATAKALLADAESLAPCATPDTDAVLGLLAGRGVRVVSFDDWKRIDAAEVARGEALGKPREKFTRVEEMLAVLE
ncbi:MAG: FAD-dependent oxidoreductase [bacterium]|nr:FAD-dependent oxidoreductase [bacterium]